MDDQKTFNENEILEDENFEEEEQQYLAWKEKYWNLYYIEIGEEEFLFRELSRHEYRVGMRLYSDDEVALEDYICKTCTLDPADFNFDNCPAGIPTELANTILFESGFQEDTGRMDEYITTFRQEMNSPDNMITCMIKEAFPDLSFEEIDSWPMQKTIWYFARAEFILREFRGIVMTTDEVDAEYTPYSPSTPVTQEPEAVPNAKVREFNTELHDGSSPGDFSELREINAFMKGKWVPPGIPESDELI